MPIRRLVVVFVALLFVPLGTAQALRLDVWNVDELSTSDDSIDLQLGSFAGLTTLTLRWIGGATDSPGAIGVDKLFINDTDRRLSVIGVFEGAISLFTNVTWDWLPTRGGTTAGGGFGRFVEKVADPGGRGGVARSLVFVLDGHYPDSSFIPNAEGATFAAHVRYANGCSGWVSDGGRAGSSGSDAQCASGGPGGGASAVPEPSAALVFGAGLLVVGGGLGRRHASSVRACKRPVAGP